MILKQQVLGLGKTIEESRNEIEKNEASTKINTLNIETKENQSNKSSEVKKEENKNETNTKNPEEVKTNKDEEEQTYVNFIKPVDGEISKQYAKENLIYSKTLEEWTTHLGIDIKANKTTVVKASADGKVKSIKNDPRYGLSIIIEHQNGYETLYSNLLTTEFVEVGEHVKQGASIGTVGNTATFEILDEAHLHFEIIKDGNNLDPNQLIK